MSNSPLVTYTRISPNKTSPRNHAIDTISIHCMAGQLTVQSCGNVFAPTSRKASSNYGIGPDGAIGMYVEEKDRSWCTSSASNDNRAITIEVASDNRHPYAVTAAAYNSLIELLVDICKRNNIKKLLWKGDPNLIGQVDKQNMTVHRWFAKKACPGDYLYNKHGEIASEVNKRLQAEVVPPVVAPPQQIKRRVAITTSALNIRSGPSVSYTKQGVVRKGEKYDIVEISNTWGKLADGRGWISLSHRFVKTV